MRTVRIPILTDDSGPLRLSQADPSELAKIHSLAVSLAGRFRGASLVISGPNLRISLPIPGDLEEFKALIDPIRDRIRVIVLLWTPGLSCYLDLCANLMAACENNLVISGEDELVREVVEMWRSLD